MLFEHLRKTKIYFKKWNSYWQLNLADRDLAVDPGKLGSYPLDFKPRVLEGHYPHFDSNGVPMWPKSNGKGHFYHYTTMFSYALGQSDFYLVTGDEKYLKNLIAVADYIVKSGKEENGTILLREVDDNDEHTGNISAMTQGEAMSVLCRTSQYTYNDSYFETALKLVAPFEIRTTEGGVLGLVTKTDTNWYEEYVSSPLNHVLNGMVYSLWGLRDIFLMNGDAKAKELYEKGAGYITKALPYFDTGYWTYYWIPESGRNYVASMMYHNLHICQLQALYKQTGIEEFKTYSDKFVSYANSPSCRFKAAKAIASAKVFKN